VGGFTKQKVKVYYIFNVSKFDSVCRYGAISNLQKPTNSYAAHERM